MIHKITNYETFIENKWEEKDLRYFIKINEYLIGNKEDMFWTYVPNSQTLSEDFIYDFRKELNWLTVLLKQKISVKFLCKVKEIVNEKYLTVGILEDSLYNQKLNKEEYIMLCQLDKKIKDNYILTDDEIIPYFNILREDKELLLEMLNKNLVSPQIEEYLCF